MALPTVRCAQGHAAGSCAASRAELDDALYDKKLPSVSGLTHVQDELISQKFSKMPAPSKNEGYHVFVSDHNPGAEDLALELAGIIRADDDVPSKRFWSRQRFVPLEYTNDPKQMKKCDHFLLLLDKRTWRTDQYNRSRKTIEALAQQVAKLARAATYARTYASAGGPGSTGSSARPGSSVAGSSFGKWLGG